MTSFFYLVAYALSFVQCGQTESIVAFTRLANLFFGLQIESDAHATLQNVQIFKQKSRGNKMGIQEKNLIKKGEIFDGQRLPKCSLCIARLFT